MGFFSQLFGKSHNTPQESNIAADVTLYAPVTGTLLPLEEVPDIVISEKVMGEGIAIVPETESIVAPCDGVVTRLLDTKNAFAIRSQDGVEVYVSFGIEAMEMEGEGFNAVVNIGDEVQKGDTILHVDLLHLKNKLKSIVTSMIVIKSSADIDKVISATGHASVSNTPVLWILLNK